MLKSRQGISSDPTNPEVTAATYEDVARWISLGQALAQQMLVHIGMDLLLKASGHWLKWMQTLLFQKPSPHSKSKDHTL